MSVPTKHHYLPQFFIRRWACDDGRVIEFRRPRNELLMKRKWPSETGFVKDLYANEAKADPVERQALELLFMQKVDDKAADALTHLEQHQAKPSDATVRDAWSRFLMSLMHRSPERVRYLTAKVKAYEADKLNPEMGEKYDRLRGPDDPPTYEAWLEQAGPITPDLRVRLLARLIDSKLIGQAINTMIWEVRELRNPRYGFLTGDQPVMISNGLGHPRGFVLVAISPTRFFVAANDQKVIDAFTNQRPNAMEEAMNDACVRQSNHVVITKEADLKAFVDIRFLKSAMPVGQNGLVTWNSPLVDI